MLILLLLTGILLISCQVFFLRRLKQQPAIAQCRCFHFNDGTSFYGVHIFWRSNEFLRCYSNYKFSECSFSCTSFLFKLAIFVYFIKYFFWLGFIISTNWSFLSYFLNQSVGGRGVRLFVNLMVGHTLLKLIVSFS